jgi:DNA-binding LytR/AlgR family response regulator
MKILICDGNSTFASACQSDLRALAEKHGIKATVETVDSGEKLLFYWNIRYADVDLLYLAYGSGSHNGMETAQELRKRGVTADIIFYCSDADHAIEAYDVDALHYLVKDQMGGAKFEEIFLKAVRRYQRRWAEVISFAHGGERVMLPVRDILYFEVKNRTVTVHYLKDRRTERFTFNSSLREIIGKLGGKGFVQTHRAYLVAEQHIRKRSPKTVEMVNGDQLPIGKSYQKTGV